MRNVGDLKRGLCLIGFMSRRRKVEWMTLNFFTIHSSYIYADIGNLNSNI